MADVDELADRLAGAGVELCAGVVGGGSSLDLADALRARGVTVVGTALESSAVVAATGAWRASGRPAVATSIKGPGLGASLAGITFASMERRPVVTLAETFGAAPPTGGRHKWISHEEVLRPLVRAFADLQPATEQLPRLLAAATGHPSGPVHIELGGEGRLWTSASPDGAASDDAAEQDRARAARRPVLVLGSRAPAGCTGTPVAPTFTTASAKGSLDESHRLAAGVLTGAGGPRSPERRILEEADLVVAVGVESDELLRAPTGPPWVPLSAVPDGLASWGADLVGEAVTDVRSCLHRGGWWPGAVVEAIDAVAWEHTLVCDTGAFNTLAEHLWTARDGRAYDSSGIARWMGTGIPLALGWALATDRATLCLTGDGGVAPVAVELRIAADRSLPLCVVLVQDGAYRSVRTTKPMEPGDPRLLPSVDWAALAGALGLPSHRCRSADDLRASLDAWDRRGPMLVVCDVDRDWDMGPLTEVRT